MPIWWDWSAFVIIIVMMPLIMTTFGFPLMLGALALWRFGIRPRIIELRKKFARGDWGKN